MHSVMRSDFLNRFLSLDRFQRDSRLHVCAETPPLPRFHSAPFRGSRFYTLFTGPNFGEQLKKLRVRRPRLEIFRPKSASEVEKGTVARHSATCPITRHTTPARSVQSQLKKRSGGALDARMYCVVSISATQSGRHYSLPTD